MAAQPLALLVDMQKYVQEKYSIKCSRASLSRRIREMGYTRGIIRRGFRAEDQQVPQISQADMLRIMGDPSPDDEMVGLPPNAKRARYAWLLDAEKPVKKIKRTKKVADVAEDKDESAGPVDPALENTPGQLPQGQSQTETPLPASNGYSNTPLYISPYRHVTADGGLVLSAHPLDSNRSIGQHTPREGATSVSRPPHV